MQMPFSKLSIPILMMLHRRRFQIPVSCDLADGTVRSFCGQGASKLSFNVAGVSLVGKICQVIPLRDSH